MERTTRRLLRLWTLASVAAIVAASALAVGAGGRTQWTRVLLGVVSTVGFVRATRHRATLHLGVGAGLVMLAIVPIDATTNRGLVAGVGAILVLIAAESAHVARRLVTIAPVDSSRRDVAALVQLATAAGIATAITGVVAQADRWGARPLIAGLAVAAIAFVALLGRDDAAAD